MPALTILSPAKLNLFLHITGRQEDGYHELQTVFQLLDYGDTLTFETSSSEHTPGNIELISDYEDIKDEDNLILKTAKILREHAAKPQNTVITLKKVIPLGGGLGGGSSNAASTLLALNKLWKCGLSLSQLAAIGLTLGADVPVFVHGESAWAEGRGEILTPMPIPKAWYVVLTPPCHASTREIFCHEQLTRNTSPLKIAAFKISDCRNDCEQVAISLYPEIETTLKWLSQFAPARMTGTGASAFASFNSKNEAMQVLERLPDNVNGFAAEGVDISPVQRSF
jgi:4-diphosphocytidyl-2-C-methyl-D-erythritol kinase